MEHHKHLSLSFSPGIYRIYIAYLLVELTAHRAHTLRLRFYGASRVAETTTKLISDFAAARQMQQK